MPNDKHNQIAQRAREIWQREGCPQGRADAHWKQAEEELGREAGQTGSSGQSAPYVPADDDMIEPAADSPVIAGASVPAKPPLPAAEAEQRKSASQASSEGSAPYVPSDEPMIQADADSPVIAGASVPSEPPTPAAEVEQRKRAATAKSAAPGSKSASSKTNDKKKKKKE
jgi:hypothetical protein